VLGKEGPYVGRFFKFFLEGEEVRVWGKVLDPLEQFGGIWPVVCMYMWFECPKRSYGEWYYPYWPAGPRKLTYAVSKYRPGERYPYEQTYEFKFKAEFRASHAEKPCGVFFTQKWKAHIWYGIPPLNWYRGKRSWKQTTNHPRCLGELEWVVIGLPRWR